ncbi:MAG: hypothetical protein J6C85_07830 [Alphaproteobacteria bacterium]|nr:hypothetical protein [Alphaproteobacteria bacterium]
MKKLAVCLHLYDLSQTEDFLEKINHIKEADIPFDLFISVSNAAAFQKKQISVVSKITQLYPDAVIIPTPNAGYDIGPFIEILHHIDLNQYSYILKLHTKRREKISYAKLNRKRYDTALWRKILLNELIGSKEIVLSNIEELNKNDTIGMIGPTPLIVEEKNELTEFAQCAASLGLSLTEPLTFVAGTMFFIKSSLLKPFLNYQISDFAPTEAAIHDKTLAHTMERMFGLAVTAQKHQIKGVSYHNYQLESLRASIRRFFIQKRHTSKGKLIIKVFMIPVYIKKASK